MLDDGGRVVIEATTISEYLDARFGGAPRVIPGDPLAAVEVRMLGRVFDKYVMTPTRTIDREAVEADQPYRHCFPLGAPDRY